MLHGPRIQGTQLLLIADDFRVDGGSIWLDKRLVASTRNLTSITCNDEQVWTP